MLNLALKESVKNVGKPEIAKIMLSGVLVGGSPYWPSSLRWDSGWPYYRGYKPLSAQERTAIKTRLKEYVDIVEPNVCQQNK